MKRLAIMVCLIGLLCGGEALALYSINPTVFNEIKGSQLELTYNYDGSIHTDIIQIGSEIYSDGGNGVYLKIYDQNGWTGNLWCCMECSPMPGFRNTINIDNYCYVFTFDTNFLSGDIKNSKVFAFNVDDSKITGSFVYLDYLTFSNQVSDMSGVKISVPSPVNIPSTKKDKDEGGCFIFSCLFFR